jgi:tetratricopeptide (TPR) repeat protein
LFASYVRSSSYKIFMQEDLTDNDYQDLPQDNLGFVGNNDQLVGVDYENVSTGGKTGEPSPTIRKIIRWLVYTAAFLVPLFFSSLVYDNLEFNKQILLIVISGIGLVLYLIDVIKSGVLSWRPSRFYLPIVGLVLAGIISVIFSVSRFSSLFGNASTRSFSFISLASLAVLFFLATNVIEDKGKALKNIISVSLILALVYGVLQIMGIYLFKGVFASRAFNSINSINALAVLAALSLAIFSNKGTMTVSDDWQRWATKGLRYLGFLLALFVIILVNWWVVWAISFCVISASVAFSSAVGTSSHKNSKMILFAVPMAVIVLGILLMLVHFNWTSLKSKFPVEVAPSQRTSWQIARSSIKSKPMGIGLENFSIAYDKWRPAAIANSVFYQLQFTEAGSEAANMAIEGGIPMLLVLLFLLGSYGQSLMSQIHKGFNLDKSNPGFWAASLGILVAIFLYPLNLTMITLLILFLALHSLEMTKKVNVVNLESNAKYSFVGSLSFIVGLVVVLVAGYFTVNNYISNIYLAKAAATKDHNKAVSLYVESVNADPNDDRILRLLSQEVLAQLGDDLKSGLKKNETRDVYNSRIQNEVASAVNISLRATNVDPADSNNWVNRAIVYQNLINLVSGADSAAINMYNEALSRNPNDPSSYFGIANIYLTVSDILRKNITSQQNTSQANAIKSQINTDLSKAEQNFQKAISLYNNFGQALFNLAVVYDREGRLPEAVKQFEKLQAANPSDPSLAFQLGLLYYRNNQKDNALAAWQRAVFLFPDYSNARWYLSLIYEERGDLANALIQVQAIQKLNPNNNLVQQRLAQLQAGKRTIPPEKVLDKKPL